MRRRQRPSLLKVFAGGKHFVDSPASDVPLLPASVAFAPDGRLYVLNRVQGEFFRFDPSTSTITAMPGLSGQLDYTAITTFAVAQDGTIFAVLNGRPIVKLDLEAGAMVPFPEVPPPLRIAWEAHPRRQATTPSPLSHPPQAVACTFRTHSLTGCAWSMPSATPRFSQVPESADSAAMAGTRASQDCMAPPQPP